MVTVLELSDDAPVVEMQKRILRCKNELKEIEEAAAGGSTAALDARTKQHHDRIESAVNNRLPLIEETVPLAALKDSLAAVMALVPQLKGAGARDVAKTASSIYDALHAAAGYHPPIVFEIDSDHLRAKQLLQQRPWRDRLDDAERKLASLYNDLDAATANKGTSPEELAHLAQKIVNELQAESAIAHELSNDPEWKQHKAELEDVGARLARFAPTFTDALKDYAKAVAGGGDGAAEIARVKAERIGMMQAQTRLMDLIDPANAPGPSLLSAVDAVAKAIAALSASAAAGK